MSRPPLNIAQSSALLGLALGAASYAGKKSLSESQESANAEAIAMQRAHIEGLLAINRKHKNAEAIDVAFTETDRGAA